MRVHPLPACGRACSCAHPCGCSRRGPTAAQPCAPTPSTPMHPRNMQGCYVLEPRPYLCSPAVPRSQRTLCGLNQTGAGAARRRSELSAGCSSGTTRRQHLRSHARTHTCRHTLQKCEQAGRRPPRERLTQPTCCTGRRRSFAPGSAPPGARPCRAWPTPPWP